MTQILNRAESESVGQNTLDANEECYSERSLRDQSENKSINTTANSLRKIKEILIENANNVIIGSLRRYDTIKTCR